MSGLGQVTLKDFGFIASCLEGFFYGIYSGIFAIYLYYHFSKQSTDYRRTTSIIFYSLCILYVLSIVQMASDSAFGILEESEAAMQSYNFYVISIVVSGCCDFIAQSILIYRCWIVWNRNIRVVIIPSILAFVFLGLWLVNCDGTVYDPSEGQIVSTFWSNTLAISLAMSLTANTLVTSLIVLKIFKVYSESKSITFDSSGGNKLRPIIFIIIESGMVLFVIQLVRLVVTIGWRDPAIYPATRLILGIHEMLNGIAPTIIQVRVSMGLSFHDQPSLEEVTSSLRFASDQNSISGMGSHGEENSLDSFDTQHLGSVYQGPE